MGRLAKRKVKISRWMWFNLISLAVTAVILLGVVVGNRGVDRLLARWGSLDPYWTLAALGGMTIYWLLEGWVLHILTGCLYWGVSFWAHQRTGMIGQLYSALTPFATGGQPVQMLYMQRDGLDAGGAGSVLAVKSVIYQLGVMLVAIAAIFTSYGFFRDQVPAFGVLATAGFAVSLVVTSGMLLVAISPRVTNKLYRGIIKALRALRLVRDVDSINAKAQKQFEIFHQSTRRYEKKTVVLVMSMLISCVQLLSLYAVSYAIYRAFGYNEPGAAVHIISAVAFVTMVADFVPLPGGAGGAEGSFVLFLALFFPEKDLLEAMLLWRILTFYLGMAVGAAAMSVSRKRQRACIRLSQ